MSVNYPLVSVIMPVYNGEKYLAESIESVLSQQFKDFELIIIDDGSTDNSKSIIKSYVKKDNRVKIFCNKSNLGISGALNKAIVNSTGEYIARMDCDDISFPSRLSSQVELLNMRNDVGLCGTWGVAINEVGKKSYSLHTLTGVLLNYNYWKPSPVISSSSMFRRCLLDKQLFDLELSTVEDFDLWLRLKKKCLIYNINMELVCYRINAESVTRKDPSKQRLLSMIAFKKNIDLKIDSLDDYLSLVCLEFNMGFWKRFGYLIQLSKIINYPCWMIVADNGYYMFRKILYYFLPSFKIFK